MKYLRRGSGYYIDVGASQLIIDGKIKLAHGQVDGGHRDRRQAGRRHRAAADLIVFATGYGSMNGWAAQLISRRSRTRSASAGASAPTRRRIRGRGKGELRNMWKPTQQEALWFHGGNLHQSRHYSQFLSLQLKARQVGMPTPVYGLAESASGR
jgi:putative flavoprotein involved in K+ transport